MKCDELNTYNIEPLDATLYLKEDVDEAIAELKQKLEDVQASTYAESVDAGMRERRLRRALWLARAERARVELENAETIYEYNIWETVERLCRAKAE